MPQLTWDKLLCARRSREYVHARPEDVRTEFRKDYHRIIGSVSFRRLQDKTQVYMLGRGDFVRTRLTHSMEVSSFAGSLGDTIFRRLIAKGKPGVDHTVRENCCDILECAGLVHDIGNPSFGHFGENVIRQWFSEHFDSLYYKGKPVTELLTEQQKQDFLNFEGNAEALRVLTRLHCLIDTDNGMNLTYALLDTIIKYPVSSLGINKNSGNVKDKKMGYFAAEQELFENITAGTGAVDCRCPLTFILESADDIAYKTADIEDAAIKKLITYTQLLEELESPVFSQMCESEEERRFLKDAAENLRHCYISSKERGMPMYEKKAVQRWAVNTQSRLIYSASDAFCDNYEAIMSGELKKELLSASPARVLAYALSDIAYRYAFQSPELLKTELSAETMLDVILDKVSGAVMRSGTAEERISDKNLITMLNENYREVCRRDCEGKSDAQQAYRRLLLLTDCICGMTDGYAREIYRCLCGIDV